jgi:phosphoadenosine phosphosulfate reductase
MSTTLDLADLALHANAELEGATALEIMGWAAERFGSGLVVTSSMADTVMVHLAEQVAPGIDVVFLDTGYHFVETIGTRDAVRAVHDVNVIDVTAELTVAEQVAPGVDVVFLDTGYHFVETIGTRDAVRAVHDVNVIDVTAELTVAEQDARYGKDLFATDPDRCCAMRKVAPLGRALEPYAAWATGLRRADSAARAHTPVVSWDARRHIIKVAPIATWTDADVASYIERNGLMVNPLLEDGYASIGCEPCTQPSADGDLRSGRWAGRAKTECGIHL